LSLDLPNPNCTGRRGRCRQVHTCDELAVFARPHFVKHPHELPYGIGVAAGKETALRHHAQQSVSSRQPTGDGQVGRGREKGAPRRRWGIRWRRRVVMNMTSLGGPLRGDHCLTANISRAAKAASAHLRCAETTTWRRHGTVQGCRRLRLRLA
jgi:hypothetical protein